MKGLIENIDELINENMKEKKTKWVLHLENRRGISKIVVVVKLRNIAYVILQKGVQRNLNPRIEIVESRKKLLIISYRYSEQFDPLVVKTFKLK